MATWYYRAWKNFGTSEIEILNIQSVSVTRGRTQVQDPFKAGTATITGRVPSSLPVLNVGDLVGIRAYQPVDSVIRAIFVGRVADVRISYGAIAALDTYTIYLEDAMAQAGRALTTSSGGFAAGDTTWAAAEKIALDAGIPLVRFAAGSTTSTVSAQSLPNENALPILQQLIFTEQGRLSASSEADELVWYDRINQTGGVVAFTDGTVALGPSIIPAPFDEVQFYSQADSYYDRVTIEPEGLAAQTSGSGDRGFSAASYDQTTTQAANLASYVLATLSVQNATPQTVSITSQTQSSPETITLFASVGGLVLADVVLRGVKYPVYVEGATLTGNVDSTRITFNLVSTAAVNFFILDSVSFGVLDTNKLGL